LWSKVSRGIIHRNLDEATSEKSLIEANQRNIVKLREANKERWECQFFKLEDNEWRFFKSDSGSTSQVKDIIFGKPRKPEFEKFWITEEDEFQDAKDE
jgi:hypothetical protein